MATPRLAGTRESLAGRQRGTGFCPRPPGRPPGRPRGFGRLPESEQERGLPGVLVRRLLSGGLLGGVKEHARKVGVPGRPRLLRAQPEVGTSGNILSPHLCRETRVTPAPLALLGRMAWQEPPDQPDHQGPPVPPGHQDQDSPQGL